MENDTVCPIEGFGSINIRMFDGVVRKLQGVRYMPELNKNLIFSGTLDAKGCGYTGQGGVVKVSRGALVIMKAIRQGNLYMLIGETVQSGASHATMEANTDDTKLWHMRLGHMSEKGQNVLHTRGVLKDVKQCKLDLCKFCIMGKQNRVSFKKAEHTSIGNLDYIHSDVWGPAPVNSQGGSRYFISFIDDFTRKTWVYFLKQKSDAFITFKIWKAQVENQVGR